MEISKFLGIYTKAKKATEPLNWNDLDYDSTFCKT